VLSFRIVCPQYGIRRHAIRFCVFDGERPSYTVVWVLSIYVPMNGAYFTDCPYRRYGDTNGFQFQEGKTKRTAQAVNLQGRR